MALLIWVACVALAVDSVPQPAGPGADTIEQLRSFTPGGGRDRLAELLTDLRNRMPVGRSPEWAHLWSIVRDPSALPVVRVGVMTVLLDKADAQTAGVVIKELGDVAKAVDDGLRHGAAGVDAESGGLLLSVFAKRMGAEPWRSWLASSPDGANLLLLLAGPAGGMEARSLALGALVGSPLPVQQRRWIAEQLVLGEQTGGEIGPAISLLNAESFPLLRRAVLESAGDPTTFHWGAAKALAHLGDADILPQLRLIRNRFLHSAAPDIGRKCAENLDYLIKQIDLQHPPSNLARYIASNEGIHPSSSLRVWAVSRALELGVDPAELRQAILVHASLVDAMLRQGELPGRTDRGWPTVRQLKAVGLANGVLLPGDLPDVRDVAPNP